MKQVRLSHYKSPMGEMIMGSLNGSLCMADWQHRNIRTSIIKRISDFTGAGFAEGDDPVLQQARTELDEYFSGTRTQFTLPLLLAGTTFQMRVWELLLSIPYGQTRTYLQLAKEMGNPGHVRAVASANGANALSIFIPCHRIIGSNGALTGYAGGLEAKQYLLRREGARFQPLPKAIQTNIAFE